MKKILSILSMLLLGCALYAGPVTPEKALQVAQRVFASASATKATDPSALQIVWDGEFEPVTKSAQDPAFYVVSRSGGGFVMVAGNDNVQPVLAFSFENDFKVEGMPDNVRWWMQQYKDYVRSVGSATPQVRAQWERYEETKATASPYDEGGITDEFLGSRTNLWNQTNPANYYCPDVEGQTETSVCGCVPLAIAEVMAWFGTANYSDASKYVVPAYSYNSDNGKTVNIEEHTLATVYAWASLKKLATASDFYGQINNFDWSRASLLLGASQTGHYTLSDLGDNLAHLVYDIGTLIKAQYNDVADNTGTGALTSDIIRAVAPVFHYNNTVRYASMDQYTNGQWQQMMKEQITNHPVIYDGVGHAYVADGYGTHDSDLLFHFNLGWGGSNNGYYTLYFQNAFEGGHSAIFDFYPNPTSYAALPVMGFTSIAIDKGGIFPHSGYNTTTHSFYLKHFYNMGAADFFGQFYIGVVDASGTLVGTPVSISNPEGIEMVPIGSTTWSVYSDYYSCEIPGAAFGQQLVPYYKESGKEDYHPFIFDPKDVTLPALPVFPAAAIKKNTSYHTGDHFVFELTNHGYSYENSTWKITAPSGTTTSYNMDDYRVQLTEVGDYKISCTTPGQETVVTYITVE